MSVDGDCARFQLWVATVAMKHALAETLNKIHELLRWRFDCLASDIGIARPLWRVLLIVSEREGSHQASLADALKIEHIIMTRHLDRLKAMGLVERRPDPQDRRLRRVYLTTAAPSVIDRMRAVLAKLEEDALGNIAPTTADALDDLLSQIQRNLANPQASLLPAPESRFAGFLG